MTDAVTDAVGMTPAEVHRVVDALTGAGCAAWLVGGWGVDALVGRQTRRHRDLDLLVDATVEAAALEALGRLGYRLAVDWRPVRFELRAPPARCVDLHPVAFDENGDGVQAGPDGTTFRYPAGSFTTGAVGGRAVRCLTAARQRELHHGYAPRAVDQHDLALLREVVP